MAERATVTQVLDFYKQAPLELAELAHRLGGDTITSRQAGSAPSKPTSSARSKKMKEAWARRKAAAASTTTAAPVTPPRAVEQPDYEQEEVNT